MIGDTNIFMTDNTDVTLAEIEIMIAETCYRKNGRGKESTLLMLKYGKINILQKTNINFNKPVKKTTQVKNNWESNSSMPKLGWIILRVFKCSRRLDSTKLAGAKFSVKLPWLSSPTTMHLYVIWKITLVNTTCPTIIEWYFSWCIICVLNCELAFDFLSDWKRRIPPTPHLASLPICLSLSRNRKRR